MDTIRHNGGNSRGMGFTEYFIRRPVVAVVLSLFLLLLGLFSLSRLPVRLYPKIDSHQIAVTTIYPGADAEVVQGYVTRTIASAISGVDGIEYVTTKSIQGQSTVTAVLELGADADKAMTGVMASVDKIKYLLPRESYDPEIVKTTTGSMPLFYIGFTSTAVSPEGITDFLKRVAQPRLAAVKGVSRAVILGPGEYAMRVDLDPLKMASLKVSALEVEAALLDNDFRAAPGEAQGGWVLSHIRLDTGLDDPESFRRLVIRAEGDGYIRLGDVADVRLGPRNSVMYMYMNGEPAVFVDVSHAPSANPLRVGDRLNKALEDIRKVLPPGIKVDMGYDATLFIRAAVKQIISTLGMTVAIVVAVIVLFLAALRSAVIPVVALLLSMVGVCSLMLVMGFSLNILTMMAMILAIGLVVDDAILVTENTTRHMEAGLSPLDAAVAASREVTTAILSMTVTLVAVFSPLAFMGGLTGSLFREFALTLAGSVVASAVVALTLSPVMASWVLKAGSGKSGPARLLDAAMEGVRKAYEKVLADFMAHRPGALLIGGTLLACCGFLYTGTPKELAPKEDQGMIIVQGTAPSHANLDYLNLFAKPLNELSASHPEVEKSFVMNGYMGRESVFAIYSLKPWSVRTRSQSEIMQAMTPQVSSIAGLQCYAFGMPTLPGSSGLPVQFVLTTAKGNDLLYDYQEKMVGKAMDSGMFTYVAGSLKFDTPVTRLAIDRDKAAELGVTMAGIGGVYQTFTSDAYVNRYIYNGLTYQVIPRLERSYLDASRLLEGEVRTASGDMAKLSGLVRVERRTGPNALTQFDQIDSATISGSLMPGVTLGEALGYLQELAGRILPPDMGIDYLGESRQYMQEGYRLVAAFAAAVLVIYLVLAAQFNTFRDPLIILLAVPGALCGALVPLYLGLATVNIFTQVGLLTLTGLIAKHAIMLVVMANQLQRTRGLDRKQAAFQGALIRLRPFLMTTAAMAVAMVPLLFAGGAGASSRFNIGLVLFCGLIFGSVATLIVVPALYSFLALDLRPKAAA